MVSLEEFFFLASSTTSFMIVILITVVLFFDVTFVSVVSVMVVVPFYVGLLDNGYRVRVTVVNFGLRALAILAD